MKNLKRRSKNLKFVVLAVMVFVGIFALFAIGAKSDGETPSALSQLRHYEVPAALEGDAISLPGGTFMMGDGAGVGHFGERPPHLVRISPLRMLRYEVTRGQYVEFLNASSVAVSPLEGFNQGSEPVEDSGRPYTVHTERFTLLYVLSGEIGHADGKFEVIDEPDIPATVTWNGAALYCAWAGGRLPTEAEFEYASRAGSSDDYAPKEQYSRPDGSDSKTRPQLAKVGSYSANAWGLYDLTGNSPEWCEDWDGAYNYDLEYWRRRAERSAYWAARFSSMFADYDSLVNPYFADCLEDFPDGILDPSGPDKPGKWYDSKVVRGGWVSPRPTDPGAWMLGSAHTGRYSARNRANPPDSAAGFRCVWPLNGDR